MRRKGAAERRAQSAPGSPERGAGRSSRRWAENAAPARPGSSEVGGPCRQPARGVPIGRLPAALRLEGGEEPRGCSRAGGGAPDRADAGGGRVGSAPPTRSLPALPPPPRRSPALAPSVGLRQLQRDPGSSRAPADWTLMHEGPTEAQERW
ncbi:translation initiation factor IF-2-like [Lutra lutra]|uniref:translation initiation factor IF-2-like n=1 Tax=Lutra lutra TaxID=9657 RepID=UPI001FD1D4BC|nr:translation initiation factor IF-2-like [Lutra lutra]